MTVELHCFMTVDIFGSSPFFGLYFGSVNVFSVPSHS